MDEKNIKSYPSIVYSGYYLNYWEITKSVNAFKTIDNKFWQMSVGI